MYILNYYYIYQIYHFSVLVSIRSQNFQHTKKVVSYRLIACGLREQLASPRLTDFAVRLVVGLLLAQQVSEENV